MIIADNDIVTPTKGQQATYELANEPKKSVTIKGGHFDAYQGSGFDISCPAAIEWFTRYLKP
jgi:fermentation-respiration switch protein FrsA (DUF1100 family)